MKTHYTESAMVAFFYELMRDHVTPGVVAQIIRDQLPRHTNAVGDPQYQNLGPGKFRGWTLTNVYLGQYAEELAEELERQTTFVTVCNKRKSTCQE